MMSMVTRFLIRTGHALIHVLIFNNKWDVFLTLVPGVLLLAIGIRSMESEATPMYLQVITYSGTTWVRHLPKMAVCCGIGAIFLGIFRFSVITLMSKETALFYIVAQSALIVMNIAAVYSSQNAFDSILDSLKSSMMHQIREVNRQDVMISLSSSLPEVWDYMQLQMSCCGVEGYRDYTTLAGSDKNAENVIPVACCAHKGVELPRPENLAQCQMDAKMAVHDSVFIHMKGCLTPMIGWLSRYINNPRTMHMAAAFSQSLAGVNGWWLYRQT